jgi:hypothetical protein
MEEYPRIEESLKDLSIPTPMCPHCFKKPLTRSIWVDPELSNGENQHESVLECTECKAVFREFS